METIRGFQAARESLSRGAFLGPSEADDREKQVRRIISEVARRGDDAVLEYTRKFDGVELASLEASQEQTALAYESVDTGLVAALRLAAERIRSFHISQREAIHGGAATPDTGWMVRPLGRVGVYAPGGTASLPSTVLMTVIPASVAGVGEVILATPPGREGRVPPLMLVAADIAGASRVFSMGGAQAIAAMALGTASVPRVDKVCGPGNIYVMLAKRLLFGVVGIDALQGPSEVVIIADEGASPVHCAADLLAQAEHDPLAASILITTSPELAGQVEREVQRQLEQLPRRNTAAEALRARGKIVLVDSLDEAIELANLYAPEHLCLMMRDARSYVDRLRNAGCIVLGERATVVLGDYVAGPSHVLPTAGTARFSSPLSVSDFLKIINVVNVDRASLSKLGEAARTIAAAEGLEGHARAIEKRLQGGKG